MSDQPKNNRRSMVYQDHLEAIRRLVDEMAQLRLRLTECEEEIRRHANLLGENGGNTITDPVVASLVAPRRTRAKNRNGPVREQPTRKRRRSVIESSEPETPVTKLKKQGHAYQFLVAIAHLTAVDSHVTINAVLAHLRSQNSEYKLPRNHYDVLSSMLHQKLIVKRGNPPRTEYPLTDRGRTVLTSTGDNQ